MPKEITKMSNLPETSKNMAEKFEKLEEKRLLEESIRKAKEKEVEKKKKLLEEREAILRKLQEEAKTKEMAERRKLQEEAKAKERAEAKRLQEEAIAKEKAEARKLQEKAKAKELFPLTATRHQPRGTGLGFSMRILSPILVGKINLKPLFSPLIFQVGIQNKYIYLTSYCCIVLNQCL